MVVKATNSFSAEYKVQYTQTSFNDFLAELVPLRGKAAVFFICQRKLLLICLASTPTPLFYLFFTNIHSVPARMWQFLQQTLAAAAPTQMDRKYCVCVWMRGGGDISYCCFSLPKPSPINLWVTTGSHSKLNRTVTVPPPSLNLQVNTKVNSV